LFVAEKRRTRFSEADFVFFPPPPLPIDYDITLVLPITPLDGEEPQFSL
jgi:hypothetical protein